MLAGPPPKPPHGPVSSLFSEKKQQFGGQHEETPMNMQDSTLERSSDTISSDRVDGTAVYGADRDKIGTVTNMLIAKREGRVTDVIVSVGGFLGIGSELHSLPWSKFSYDTELGGYLVNVTADQLKDAPRFSESDRDRPYDRDYQSSVYNYWQVQPYW